MANPIFITLLDDGRVVVEAVEFIDAILRDLMLMPEDAVIRRDNVVDALTAYATQVERAGAEIKAARAAENS